MRTNISFRLAKLEAPKTSTVFLPLVESLAFADRNL
jgi:hypothetical protein